MPDVKNPSSALLICISVSVFPAASWAFDWSDLWLRQDQQAHNQLSAGNPELAAEMFDDPGWRGASQFNAGNFKAAIDEFKGSANASAGYNRGVSEVMAGDYLSAVESFQSVLEQQPGNADAAHNLAIALELLKQQEQQQPDNDNQNQPDSDQPSESSEQSGEDQTQQEQASEDSTGTGKSDDDSGEQQSSETQSSQQADGEPSDPAQSEDSADDGGLTEDATNMEQATGGDQKAAEDLKEALSEALQSENSDTEKDQNTAAGSITDSQPVSEENQATEQWLRRIPDDPSQLLRNKIKLNHLLEHPDVGDTKEPW